MPAHANCVHERDPHGAERHGTPVGGAAVCQDHGARGAAAVPPGEAAGRELGGLGWEGLGCGMGAAVQNGFCRKRALDGTCCTHDLGIHSNCSRSAVLMMALPAAHCLAAQVLLNGLVVDQQEQVARERRPVAGHTVSQGMHSADYVLLATDQKLERQCVLD